MEITSYPGFDLSITDESIAQYDIRSRIYRNRRIGDFLKELHLIEGRNTDFPTAFEALRRNGSELPVFEMDESRGYLNVRIPIHPAFLPNNVKESDRSYEEAILGALGDDSFTLTELAHALGYKGISRKLSQAVERMLASGVLVRVVENSSRSKITRSQTQSQHYKPYSQNYHFSMRWPS
ncbi:MAG: hypothetical protein IJ125_02255 [Atopobiaceae bacterium]|nr:hypothetical protein [Atopobiaceae bacterium]